MRIMLDTNILISMLFFPSEQFKRILDYITRNHKLVLSSFVIDELFSIATRKFPTKSMLSMHFCRTWHMNLFTLPITCGETYLKLEI